MSNSLLFILIAVPFLSGIGCYLLRASILRSLVVIVTGVLLAAGSVAAFQVAPFTMSPGSFLGISLDGLIQVLDFALLFAFVYIGFKHSNMLIAGLAAAQIVLVGYLEFVLVDHAAVTPVFVGDSLALIMVLIISIVGSVICIHALPYMKNHEEHLHLKTSRQPRFFMVLILFLGAMNGLVLANNITHFYFFFELTTLCSFLLIGHDKTEEASKNALWALLLNSVGGLAMALGMVWIYANLGTLSIQEVIVRSPGSAAMLLPLALLCLAGFTKAAQLPFQSWLLGAMVAPTPTSALLHSSTMVKAGVYLVLRFAPAFAGTFLSDCVAIVGAFTFLAAAALAVSQSNGKKILAYSTVSNLGLILACAGINTSEAIAAAIFLIIFHAVSKALLFLCVGTIEQGIASRDIEDMRGLFSRMPVTAILTVLGVITMILPPFGMLLGKWMAIESAAQNLFVIIMVAMGSALTVVYWARWAGSLMSVSNQGGMTPEKQPVLTRWPLLALCAGAVFLSFGAPLIYQGMVVPAVNAWGTLPYVVETGTLTNPVGAFTIYPLFFLAAAGLLLAFVGLKRARTARFDPPYLSGAQLSEPDTFNGPMNQPVKTVMGNYYMASLVGESTLTRWANAIGIILIILMAGGAL